MKNTMYENKNLYLISLHKAVQEFIVDECKGFLNSDLQLMKKIEAARTLFPEDKKRLRQYV